MDKRKNENKKMKIVKMIAILLLLNICNSLFSRSFETADAIRRLKEVDTKQYKMSVDYLKQQFPSDFKETKQWKEALQKIETQKESLLEQLRKDDPTTLKEVLSLLKALDDNMLQNPLIKDKQLMFIKRKIGDNARYATGGGLGVGPSNFQNSSELHRAWDNEVVLLNDITNKVKYETILKPDSNVVVNDIELHWDGDKFLYSSIGANNRWHLFEYDMKNKTSRQVTPDTYVDFDSFDGCYTPDGNYIFCSTGTFLGLPCTHGWNRMCGLFLYNPQTGTTRQLTFDQDSNWGPTLLEDGKILYQRWEYSDIPHSNGRILFTMNPDGSNQTSFYGSSSYFPAALFNSRPIPGSSSKIASIASGHHSIARTGRLLSIDVAKGRQEAEGIVAEIPRYGEKIYPLERDRLPDGNFPYFMYPYPLSDTYFIVSMKPTPKSLVGLYLVDRFNNMTLIAQQEEYAYLEPMLIEKRKKPHVIPTQINLADSMATIFMQDVYVGVGLKGIPKGSVKKLRVGSYSFSPINQGGAIGAVGIDGPWDVKQILGTVDVNEDGSAMFRVPSNTPLFVQPLDSEGKALQVMRSWFTAMPGETLSCIGCHEDKNSMVIPKQSMASQKAPQEIKEWYGSARGFSYRHEVQPVLDRLCIGCHDGTKATPDLRGDKWINDWRSDIAGNAGEQAGKFTQSYVNLHRYIRRPGIESDIHVLSPMDVHADQTELMQILRKSHNGVELTSEDVERFACWIDFNAQFHGRRTEIGHWDRAQWAYKMKAKYADMFNVKKHFDYEYLPDIPKDIKTVMPKQTAKEKGDSVLKGWPHYNASEIYDYKTGDMKKVYEAWNQINLGMMRKTIHLNDNITLELVKVPAGSFIMGSENNPDEMPKAITKIEKPFWIGKFEITNQQYNLFDTTHDSRTEYRHGFQFGRRGYPLNTPQQPVVRVSWQEAVEYCKWLSKETGMEFALPTESQWEWACRAGSNTPYWFGESGANFSKNENLGDIRLKEFATCSYHKNYESVRIIDNPSVYDDWIPRDASYDDGGFVSEGVGRYRGNPWDIADMHGNVSEWTMSSYKPYPYKDNDGRNDINETDKRVARGGSWYDRPYKSTSSYRTAYRPYQKVFNVGFRVVMFEKDLDEI